MADSGAIRAGKAFVEATFQDNKLTKGLERAKKKLMAFGASVRGLGLKFVGLGSAALAPLAMLLKFTSDAAGKLVDMSQRTGLSIEALSELGHAAEQSGASLEDVEIGAKKMSKLITEAATGSKTAAETLRTLGLTFADLKGLSPDDQMAKLGDAVAKIPNATQRSAVAMEVFGKSGTKLLPMMAQGMDNARKAARDLGLTVSSQDATALDDLGDSVGVLWAQAKSAAIAIGGALAPTLTELVGHVQQIGTSVVTWIKQNRGLIASVGKIIGIVGLVIVGIGGALVALGGVFSVLGAIAGGVVAGMSAIGTALTAVFSIVSFLLSPVVLVTAAVIGLGVYFLHSSGLIGKAVATLSGVFNILKGDALMAFGGIRDALAAGDIALAMKILWTLLKLEWTRGVGFLSSKWTALKSFVQRVWTEATFSLVGIFLKAWAGLEIAWTESITFLGDAWTLLVSGMQMTWNETIGFIKKAWVRLKGLFDEDINVGAEVDRINSETEGKNNALGNEMNQAIGDRDRARQKRRQEIDQQLAGSLDAAEAERLRQQREIDERQAAKEQALQDELKSARDELAGLQQKAKDARAGAQQAEADANGDAKNPSVPDFQNIGAAVKQQFATFSGSAATRIGGGFDNGNWLAKIAKHTEETARNTARNKPQPSPGQLINPAA